MKDNDAKSDQSATSDYSSPSSFDIQSTEQQGGARPPDYSPNKQDGQKKWSLRRHWNQAPKSRQVKWIAEGIGLFIAVSGLATYVIGIIQNQRNFNMDHRAYLVAHIDTIHTATNTLEVTLENPGHSVAERVSIHANEATFNLNSIDGSIQNRMVNGWGEFSVPPIYPSSGKTAFRIPLSGLDMGRIKNVQQFIYVAIRVSYTDEASGGRQAIPPICMMSGIAEPSKEIQWTMCNASATISEMEKWDEGENQKYKWPSIPN